MNIKHITTPAQPDFPHLLTDTQAEALARVQRACVQINGAIARMNALIVENRLRVPTVGRGEIGAVFGEVERVMFEHDIAHANLRRAVDAPEMAAA